MGVSPGDEEQVPEIWTGVEETNVDVPPKFLCF